MNSITVQRGDYRITTDRNEIDLQAIHHFLSTEAYWSKNIPFETVKNAADHSLNFAVFYKDQQVGYARIISDYATVAYLGDVFVLPAFRGKGLSKWLMEAIMQHPSLQGLRRWILLTGDAHGLYRQFGWKDIAAPERWMEFHNKDVYTKQSS